MNSSKTFVYGSELQGTGEISSENVLIGLAMSILSAIGVLLGATNLYFLKKVKIFHNPFGWFWASRAVGEMIGESMHAFYNGPVTIFQPKQIELWQGITPYIILFLGSVSACQMHAAIAVNRSIAIYNPMRYGEIFSKRMSLMIIAFSWVGCFLIAAVYFVFPCNLVGYSPQFYSYTYVKCYQGQERNFSHVGTVVNFFCLLLCSCTVMVDIATLSRIIYIQKVLKSHNDDRNLKRNIRFFKQSAFQNVIMVVATVLFVHQNNQNPPKSKTVNLTQIFAIMCTHIVNPLALILFNPEVRGRLFRKNTSVENYAIQSKVTHSVSSCAAAAPVGQLSQSA